MKFTTARHGDTTKEIDKIIIYIGENRYRLRESIDGKLIINKMSDGETDDISVFPKCANQIELT